MPNNTKILLLVFCLIFSLESLFGQSLLQANMVDNNVDGNEADFIDIDLDGDLDLLVTSTNKHEILWFEQLPGNGFAKHVIDYSDGTFPQSSVGVDFDLDGDIDILSVGFDNYVHIFINDGNQNFSKSVFAGFQSISSDDILFMPNKIESTDLNNDGISDFVISQAEDATHFGELMIYNSSSVGNYQLYKINTQWSSDINYLGDINDFNNDGFPDIIFSIGQESVLIYINDGSGTFTFYTSANPIYFVFDSKVADFNNDSFLDMAVVTAQFGVEIYLNNGNGLVLNTIVPELNTGQPFAFTRAIRIVDYNNDNFQDIVISLGGYGNNFDENFQIYLNDGNGNFNLLETVFFGTLTEMVYFDIADFDGDNDLDFIVPSRSQSLYNGTAGISGLYLIKSDNSLQASDNQKDDVLIYPNPTFDIVNVKTRLPLQEVQIYDSNGREILNSSENVLHLSNLAKGIYFLKVALPEERQSLHKLIKI